METRIWTEWRGDGDGERFWVAGGPANRTTAALLGHGWPVATGRTWTEYVGHVDRAGRVIVDERVVGHVARAYDDNAAWWHGYDATGERVTRKPARNRADAGAAVVAKLDAREFAAFAAEGV